ncbi:MAG: DUF192 domain-containing protein [Granulosicoccus sp.]
MHDNSDLVSPSRLSLSKNLRKGNTPVISVLVIVGCLLLSFSSRDAFSDSSPQPRLPTVQLDINGKILTAEVAASAKQRYMGLSFRTSLAKDEGMLFVYPSEQPLTFTMRNTLIPLSIAFISKDLVINEIHHMNVGPGQLFPSRQDAQFALEVDQGWFAANDIAAGDQIIRR